MMASLYVPQLTRWREVVGGIERECVEHEGNVFDVSRAHCIVPGEGDADQRERLEIAGKLFPLVDEKEVPLHGGAVVRCVEYKSPLADVVLLTVTEGKKKVVAEVVLPDGMLRVAGCGCFSEPEIGTVKHAVDVQGEMEVFMLLVSVREDLGRIVSVKRLN